MIRLKGFAKKYGWARFSNDSFKILYKGSPTRLNITQLGEEISQLENPKQFLQSLDGHFCIVFISRTLSFAATDRVSTTQIYYKYTRTDVCISDQALLIDDSPFSPDNTDQLALTSLRMSGFTSGSRTLKSDLFSVPPGSWLDLIHNQIEKYFLFSPWTKVTSTTSEALGKSLSETILKVFERIIRDSNGSQICIPLSAGIDSRLVVSAIAELGYKNVYCFSYGLPGNFEANVASKIARQLGFKWEFIETRPKDLVYYLNSVKFREYLDFSDSLSSVPFFQDHFVLSNLKKTERVDSSCIFVNGNSGDFISGGHLPSSLLHNGPVSEEKFLEEYISKHCSLWDDLKTQENKNRIRLCINKQLDDLIIPSELKYSSYSFELLEYMNRQSKFVVSGQRNYDFFGFQWSLPLWEKEIIHFFQNLPTEYKINQSLYKNTLKKYNWGRVWSSIPINKRHTSPTWVIPAKLALKPLFIPFGQREWHRYEKRIFSYFTEQLGLYRQWPYTKVLLDKRGARNIVSWRTEQYLQEKGLVRNR